MRLRLWVVGVAASAPMLVGCGSGDNGAAAKPEPVRTTTTSLGLVDPTPTAEWGVTRSGPAVVESATHDDWPMASISGVVKLRGPCLVVGGRGEASATDALIVWPFGTVWDDAEGTVHVPSSLSVAVGTDVVGAGAAFNLDRDTSPDAIRECASPESDVISIVRLWPSGEASPSVGTMTTTTVV